MTEPDQTPEIPDEPAAPDATEPLPFPGVSVPDEPVPATPNRPMHGDETPDAYEQEADEDPAPERHADAGDEFTDLDDGGDPDDTTDLDGEPAGE